MKNKIFLIFILMLVLHIVYSVDKVSADWWQRPDKRERNITPLKREEKEVKEVRPTQAPEPTSTAPTEAQPPPQDPTQGPVVVTTALVPTEEPRIGGVNGGDEDGGDKGGEDGGDGGEVSGSGEAVVPAVSQQEPGGETVLPPVLGLSDTSGESIMLSDIILLTGSLCLSLYLRSKLAGNLLR